MKKCFGKMKRVVAVMLAAVLLMSQTSMTALAEGVDAQNKTETTSKELLTETTSEEIKTETSEDTASETPEESTTEFQTATPSEISEQNTIIDDEDPSEPVSEDEETSESVSPDVNSNIEEEPDTEIADDEISIATTYNGMVITVTGSADLLTGAKVEVTPVKNNDADDVAEAVDKAREENVGEGAQVAKAFAMDIKLKKGGEIIDLDGEIVKVTFAFAQKINDIATVNVYHLEEEEDAFEAEPLPIEVNKNVDEETKEEYKEEYNKNIATEVDTETGSFSYYVVEFTYDELQYVLEGDSSVKLSQVLAELGFSLEDEAGEPYEIKVTEISNSKLFDVEENADDGEMYIVAKEAFSTEESMTVSIGGISYVIKVTDEQEWFVKYTTGGETYYINNTNAFASFGDAVEAANAATGDTVISLNPNLGTVNLNGGDYTFNNTNAKITLDFIDCEVTGDIDLQVYSAVEITGDGTNSDSTCFITHMNEGGSLNFALSSSTKLYLGNPNYSKRITLASGRYSFTNGNPDNCTIPTGKTAKKINSTTYAIVESIALIVATTIKSETGSGDNYVKSSQAGKETNVTISVYDDSIEGEDKLVEQISQNWVEETDPVTKEIILQNVLETDFVLPKNDGSQPITYRVVAEIGREYYVCTPGTFRTDSETNTAAVELAFTNNAFGMEFSISMEEGKSDYAPDKVWLQILSYRVNDHKWLPIYQNSTDGWTPSAQDPVDEKWIEVNMKGKSTASITYPVLTGTEQTPFYYRVQPVMMMFTNALDGTQHYLAVEGSTGSASGNAANVDYFAYVDSNKNFPAYSLHVDVSNGGVPGSDNLGGVYADNSQQNGNLSLIISPEFTLVERNTNAVFSTLHQAIDQLPNSTSGVNEYELIMLSDVTLGSNDADYTFNYDKSTPLVLNFNGHSINTSAPRGIDFNIASQSSITLCDKSGSNSGVNASGNYAITHSGSGTLIISKDDPITSKSNRYSVSTTNADAKVQIQGGYFDKTPFSQYNGISVTGGYFATQVDSKYMADGYCLINNPDSDTKAKYPYKVGRGVARVVSTDKYYATLAEAIADCSNGETVQLCDNVVGEACLIGRSQEIVLDLNGKKIEGNASSPEFTNSGKLTITDSQGNAGIITAPAGTTACIVNSSTAELVLTGVRVASTIQSGGVLKISGANELSDISLGGSSNIKVTGALTGSSIGITLTSNRIFTTDYSTYNQGVDPSAYFHSTATDHSVALDTVSGEVKLIDAGVEAKLIRNGSTAKEGTLAAMFDDAVDGDIIELVTDVNTASVDYTMFANATLDINGYDLTAASLNTTSGQLMDSSTGNSAGLIKVPQNALKVKSSNEQMPLWDSKNSGYRVLEYEYIYRGCVNPYDPNNEGIKYQLLFGYRLRFTKDIGYTLLSQGNHGLEMTVSAVYDVTVRIAGITYTAGTGKVVMDYSDILQGYAQNKLNGGNPAFYARYINNLLAVGTKISTSSVIFNGTGFKLDVNGSEQAFQGKRF